MCDFIIGIVVSWFVCSFCGFCCFVCLFVLFCFVLFCFVLLVLFNVLMCASAILGEHGGGNAEGHAEEEIRRLLREHAVESGALFKHLPARAHI